ncbi:alpha/beta hydrolase-fold protein [Kitasatospora terrestris]|uniref:Alpha/beta hydrolase-fold protein n=1 Tax=Kitasatospora terrestris TaxID=258051 RepID=A0ABP9ECM5_9ACTN
MQPERGAVERGAVEPVRVGRRRLLGALAVAGIGAVAVGGAVVEDVLPGGPRLRRLLGMTGPDGAVPAVDAGAVRTERVRSAARGREVGLVTIDPAGPVRPDLPVCLALHGRGGSARALLDLGLPQFLAAVGAPMRIVAVDGGDATYWHARTPGDDPMAMLTGELPGWLRQRGLPAPTRALGISMGGSGALRYARARGGLDAVALLSPALFRSWGDARTVDGFRDEADWREHEPLLHPDATPVRRLGVWCGTEDPFCPAARTLTGRAAEARFPRGAHTDGFWRRVLPEAIGFLGTV